MTTPATHPNSSSAIAVRAMDLVKTHGEGPNEIEAVRGISVEIERDRVTAILGPTGCGASTLMHLLAGLNHPSSGSVQLNGRIITGLNDEDAIIHRREIGFICQQSHLVPTLDVMGNILSPLELDGDGPSQDDLLRTNQLVADLELTPILARRPGELSSGQQRRVAVARALAMQPTVLFADEPTGDLDSKTGRGILDFLSVAAGRYRQTVVLVTRDPVAASYADRVVLLSNGRIAQDRARSDAATLMNILMSFDASGPQA